MVKSKLPHLVILASVITAAAQSQQGSGPSNQVTLKYLGNRGLGNQRRQHGDFARSVYFENQRTGAAGRWFGACRS